MHATNRRVSPLRLVDRAGRRKIETEKKKRNRTRITEVFTSRTPAPHISSRVNHTCGHQQVDPLNVPQNRNLRIPAIGLLHFGQLRVILCSSAHSSQ